jgi:peptidoglycan/xylan/chitin deacetylase (PgdA/CDA1 family)
MTVLCYHSVDPEWNSPLAVRPAEFEAQCRWLAASGRVVDLAVWLERGRGSRAIALTFDDGFRELEEHAFPVLRRCGLPATVFVVAETLTPAGRPVDWVDTPPPWPLQTLTVDQVLAARDAGVRIASHSWAHHDLTTLGEQECARDLRESRELLEDLLGEPVPYLAYPRGRHDAVVRRAAASAGFRFSFALPEQREPTGPHAVPRVGVYPGNGVRGLRVKTARPYLPVRHSPVYPALQRLGRAVTSRATG